MNELKYISGDLVYIHGSLRIIYFRYVGNLALLFWVLYHS